MTTITVLELYPGHLMMNGDMGNGIVLRRRAELAGLGLEVVGHEPGAALPPSVDAVIVGTGPGSAQLAVADDLAVIAPALRGWVDAGVPVVAVGAGMHLLGRSVTLATGELIEGAGVFPITTQPRAERTVTDAFVVDSFAGRLIGIENQAVTVTLHGAAPLGAVVNGRGNDGRSEGVRVNEAIGTHLHGPALAMNPALADHVLAAAAAHAGLAYAAGPQHAQIDAVAREARAYLARGAGVAVDAAA